MKRVLSFLFFLCCVSVYASDQACPMHAEHTKVDERGDHVMGFDHTKTTHHFKLTEKGGNIIAEAKDANDPISISNIRKHFQEISTLFADGDFAMPEKIHGKVPPGVATMKELRNEIKYEYVETERGAEVRISTENEKAAHAIHEFLRFQIQDHRTGDEM